MSRRFDTVKKLIGITVAAVVTVFVVTTIVAKKKKPDSVYDNAPEQKNPLEGKKVIFVEDEKEPVNADGMKGHLEAVGESYHVPSFYEHYVKRGMDIFLSFGGLVVLSPVMAAIAIAIKIEDPGPVLFTQKRMGQNKQYFKLHKFRSMKMCTPHDVPTHMLDNPDQYITKVGKFIRAHSLDELPQIWDIFIGNMSVIGPRPGLWNQDVLTAERDKYGANDVKPGLTGWAQINGRDELEIPDKAKLDGDYCKNIGLKLDAKCFLGSVHVLGKDESVVEGGTGAIEKSVGRHYTDGKSAEELIGHIGFGEPVEVDENAEKKILITGAGSYIGESFKTYAVEHYPALSIDAVDMLNGAWREKDFSAYDIVYHVAGIAHADVGSVDDATKEKYYAVNTDLAVEVCKKAKADGVKKYVFMSSMIVYGDSAPYGKKKVVDENTVPIPANFYGDSKLQADVAVRELADENFKVIVLRPPMIYGRGSKGNYPTLAKLAKKIPVFPDVNNERSMLHIDDLCEFLCQIILVKDVKENAVVLIPQNAEWIRTSDMVRMIAKVSGKTIKETKLLAPAVALAGKVPGKIGGLVNKAFGNSCYAKKMSVYQGVKYQNVSLSDSIERTEGRPEELENKKVLIVASVASMIDQFNKPNIELLQSFGYDVDVAANFNKNPGTITIERCRELLKWLEEHDVDCYQIDFDRNVTDLKADVAAFKELDAVFKGTASPIDTAFNVTKRSHEGERYTFMHCHSPIGGVVGRLVAHKNRVKTIYTAHGFHFYKGAPLKNWLLYYPVERFLSRYTDVLITINKEDYSRAKKEFHAKKTVYVPGVGVDTAKFASVSRVMDRKQKRAELKIGEEDIILLSIGELNSNKNHGMVIEALGKLKNEVADHKIVYLIAGTGEKADELKQLAGANGVALRLLGYRKDISELLNAADLYILPSLREGLNVSLMEAMASGTPCLCGDIRGNVDLVEVDKGGSLFDPNSIDSVAEAIKAELACRSKWKGQGQYNIQKIKHFDISAIADTYKKLIGGGAADVDLCNSNIEDYRYLGELISRQMIRKQLGISHDAFFMISVGELSIRKNQITVLKAINKIKVSHPEIATKLKYAIVGQGSLEGEYREYIETHQLQGMVELLGYRPNVPELLRAADLFVFPSLQEGLPVALMEAMASGVPVVCSKIRGNVDLVEDGLFKPEDIETIEGAIIKEFKNSRRSELPTSFTIESVEEKMRRLYQNA